MHTARLIPILFFSLLSLSLQAQDIPPKQAFDSAKFNQNTQSLKIIRVTPEGKDVPATRQIVLQFNQPVVPVGKMERDAKDIPVTITPALNCQWRWLNTSSLACQLTEKDKAKQATRYHLLINKGFQTENGQTLAEAQRHTFITERPVLDWASFKTWKAPDMPFVRLKFNQAVSPDSVTKSVYFRSATGKRISVFVQQDTENNNDLVLNAQSLKKPLPKFNDVWLISPTELLGNNLAIELKIQPNLQAKSGPERGIEKRTVVAFHTFPAFKFLGVNCTDNTDKEVFIPVQSNETFSRCNPLQGVGLSFSSPVSYQALKQALELKPALAGDGKGVDPWKNADDYDRLDAPHERNEKYILWLPVYLKAYQNYALQLAAGSLKDEFGRPLTQNETMQFATDHRLPNYSFEHAYSVLEKGVDSEVPIMVTNLAQLHFNYTTLTPKEVKTQQQKNLPVAKAQDVTFKMPLGMRQLLNHETGVVFGEFNTTPQITDYDQQPRQESFFAQVTPFNIQVKLGHHNSLVWVTDLATGQPVADVAVQIFSNNYKNLAQNPVALVEAVTDANGIAKLKGLKELDPKLKLLFGYGDESMLFLRADKGDDMALLPLDYHFEMSIYDFSEDYSVHSDIQQKYGHIKAWGTTAQGVYKVGDTVQYKIYVRNENNKNLIPAPSKNYQLQVTDPSGKVVYEAKELVLSAFGGLDGEFALPKTAAVGWYYFNLTADFTESRTWTPLKVLVSDFTPSPFKVSTELNGKLFHDGDTVKVTTLAKLHAGGPYADATTRIHAEVQPQSFYPEHPLAKNFQFDVLDPEHNGTESVFNYDSKINQQGELTSEFKLNLPKVLYGQLMVESAVQDDRGKNVASTQNAAYVGRDRFVGLKATQWLLQQGQLAQVNALVLDAQGKPVANSAINIKVERRVTRTAKVKGAGNAYLSQYHHEWQSESECALTSRADAVVVCEFTPKSAGVYRLVARIHDSKNRLQQTILNQWASGVGEVVWESPENNRLPLVAESNRYKVGDKARYLVQNPYPNASALISIERNGVLQHWTKTLANSVEVIEFDIKPEHIPGFYLSVMLMSPRVAKPLDNNQIDLGKPAFRIGYVKTEVNDDDKTLVVNITSDKATYKPRDTVTLNFVAKRKIIRKPALKPVPAKAAEPVKSEQVAKATTVKTATPKPATAKPQAEPMELAVVVLDEAVFDLIQGGKDYFDPYQGFYQLDGLDVKNFNLLTQLVGRQLFAKKGANPAGDGGSHLSMRSLFKYVSYWNPAVKTDAAGKAQVSFQLPDNLTGWRVLAMAVTANDLMGLSDYNFKVNQLVQLSSALPNQVMVGDQFQARFMIMNRTDKTRKIKVRLETHDNLFVEQTLDTLPFQRYPVVLPISADKTGLIRFTAKAETLEADDKQTDRLQKELTVYPRRALETAATYGSTNEAQVTESLAFPKDIYPDTGDVSVTVAPTVINNVDGAFAYMRDYPYMCWEQKLSKAVMASHYQRLKPWLSDHIEWEDSVTLPQDTLKWVSEYQAPNGGMAYFVPQDERVGPYLSAYTALAFVWLRDAGHEIPIQAEAKLHDYLKNLLRKDVLPDFYSQGMTATVRAVALAALAQRQQVGLADIQRYAPHVPQMSLFGQAQFLTAARQIKGTAKIQAEILQTILNKAVQSGGKVTFNETLDDGYDRILASSLRDNCAVLSSLLSQPKALDIPMKMVRAISASRKNRDHWENTQENMFCMNALIDYAKVYEKDRPNMEVEAWFNQTSLGKTAFNQANQPEVSFKRNITAQDLASKATVALTKTGQGRLYYGVRMAYASKQDHAEAINAGMDVRREYSVERDGQWLLLTSPLSLKTGELVKVDLFLSLPTARNFVVVNDPVPGGLEPVNRDLATASKVDADKANGDYAGGSFWFNHNDWQEYGASFWNFYHQELRHHAAIFYADYLPAGNYHLAYTAQAMALGEFSIMPTHAEEMYEPDVYGISLPQKLIVRP